MDIFRGSLDRAPSFVGGVMMQSEKFLEGIVQDY